MATPDDNGSFIEPRPAATVVVVRDGEHGPEVLLLQRTHSAVFLPGVFVFPGGAVDAADQDPALAARAGRLDEAAAGYIITAIRECFEEGGLLLADIGAGADAGDLATWRRRLARGEVSFAALCEALDLELHADRMVYLDRWVTPPGGPRRFDARFFLAPAPPDQPASHDGVETIDHAWMTPSEALERNRHGTFPLGSPTMRTLRTLAEFESADGLLDHVRRLRWRPGRQGAAKRAVTASGRDGIRTVHPDDPAWAELAKLRDEGLGQGSYEILPGVARRLSQRVTRLTAPNPGMMTGPGTNTYLVDCGEGLAVIDPGPELNTHIEAILDATHRPVRWILATHTHPDHSPGTRALKAHTGAPVFGMPAPRGESQDQRFAPDHVPADGEALHLGAVTLRAIHTPGHASNHLCYLLEDERLLFSGDHIMQGSTVVISPPDGNMADYLYALDRLHGEQIDYIAPGHGFLMADPDAVIDRIIEHRMAREQKVLNAVRRLGRAAEADLLPAVYDDVPDALHRVALRSLQAHLIKLHDEGSIKRDANGYVA